MRILCSISTKNRYETYLPMAIMSVVNQTRLPDKLIIYDDNDEPKDLNSIVIYKHLFHILITHGVKVWVEIGAKKGQHYNHQRANESEFDAVWRLDDDCIAESDVLEKLEKQLTSDVGAVGGSIITPSSGNYLEASSDIDGLDKPNKQWNIIAETEEVEHLHCSFLYRPKIVDYNLTLSKKAHREETMFTYALHCKGYKILITPCITWHLKSETGGIRSDNNVTDYEHDEIIFNNWLFYIKSGKKLFVVSGGVGDNYAFLQAIDLPENAIIATVYPWIYEELGYQTISIEIAESLVDIKKYDIYHWAVQNNWNGSLIDGFKKIYENINC